MRLRSGHWLVVAIVGGLLATLTLIAVVNRPPPFSFEPPSKPAVSAPVITVWVEGAVHHPRFHQIAMGTTVGELIDQLDLTDDAMLYRLRKRQVLVDHQTVVIPKRKRSR